MVGGTYVRVNILHGWLVGRPSFFGHGAFLMDLVREVFRLKPIVVLLNPIVVLLKPIVVLLKPIVVLLNLAVGWLVGWHGTVGPRFFSHVFCGRSLSDGFLCEGSFPWA